MDIVLKLLTKEDIELVRIWRNSPEVSQFMYTENKISVEQQVAWFEKIKDDNTSKFWIIEYDNQKIGLASLTGISNTLSSCYWAFYLGTDIPRGGGIGSKIEYNILEYVFNELKLNKLRCEVMNFNDKVISMHEKFGFRREAYYRQHIKKNGKWIDTIGLAILSEEWKKQKDFMKKIIYRT
jgi:UDP-4-amino-4,6-dideoxy-N-acetyl-beta-L-altrosamine N-acetyltransferase